MSNYLIYRLLGQRGARLQELQELLRRAHCIDIVLGYLERRNIAAFRSGPVGEVVDLQGDDGTVEDEPHCEATLGIIVRGRDAKLAVELLAAHNAVDLDYHVY